VTSTGSPPDPIPAVRLDNRATWEAVHDRLEDLVLSGRFILGAEVEEFESKAAQAFGCSWAVGTSSGTSAITLALRAAPIPPRSRVALPANTFYAVLEAVVQAGHVPVVIDHGPDHVVTSEELERVEARAVVAVHLYGLPVDMDPLIRMAQDRGWWVLEDCSQAHGSTIRGRPVGSFGDAAAFSAYPTKNLGAWGDAGFVTGSDPELRDRIAALRHHGQRRPSIHEEVGATERLDAIQALVLTEKLRLLPQETEARRGVADRYREALRSTDLDLPGDRGDRRHSYQLFVIRVPDRDRVRACLADAGIGTGIHYPIPIHLQPGAQGRADVPATPRRAEAWAPHLLSLPMYPSLTAAEVGRVAAVLREAMEAR
jgi:dTDP-4-amino-4,6-dideoxygalactose transaminase